MAFIDRSARQVKQSEEHSRGLTARQQRIHSRRPFRVELHLVISKPPDSGLIYRGSANRADPSDYAIAACKTDRLGNQPLACWIADCTGDLAGVFGRNSGDARLPKPSRSNVSLGSKRHAQRKSLL